MNRHQLWLSVGAWYAVPMVRGSPNPRHFGLPARLRRAGRHSGLTRMALAQKAGVSTATALYAATGQRLPTVASVARLAAGFAVSAGWLAYGLGDMMNSGPPATCDGMGARLQAMRIERGLTKAALARLADLSPSSFAKIENGGQTGIDVLEALAQALGVSPGWLAFGIGPQVLPSRRRSRQQPQPAEPEP